MEYSWEYNERKINNGEYIFHGKEIGVISENFIDFHNTLRNKYHGGKIHRNSHYFVNNHMFHAIVHLDHVNSDFTDIIQTSIGILNPFYFEICDKINKIYPPFKTNKYNPQEWTFYHDENYHLFF